MNEMIDIKLWYEYYKNHIINIMNQFELYIVNNHLTDILDDPKWKNNFIIFLYNNSTQERPKYL